MKMPRTCKLYFRHIAIALFALCAAAGAIPSLAQSCAAPIPITLGSTANGNNCGTNNIPYLANGMLSMPGPDVVYKLTVADPAPEFVAFVLWPNAASALSLAVCTGSCGSSSNCVGIAESTSAGAPTGINLFQPAPGDYYVIVDSAFAAGPMGCGNYSIGASGPLDLTK